MDAKEGLPVQKKAPGDARWKIISLITLSTMMFGKFTNHTGCSEPEETETTVSFNGDSSENHTKLKQEMDKVLYQAGIAANFGLIAMKTGKLEGVEQVIVMANAMGCALIYYGFQLQKTTPKFGMILEQVGAGIILVSIHLLIATYLLWWLRIFIALCCIVSITPLLMALLALKINHSEVPTPTPNHPVHPP